MKSSDIAGEDFNGVIGMMKRAQLAAIACGLASTVSGAAFADPFAWEDAEVSVHVLEMDGGVDVACYLGLLGLDLGDRIEAVIVVGTGQLGDAETGQVLLREMVDSVPVISTLENLVIAEWSIMPFGAYEAIDEKRCWGFDAAEGGYELVQCPQFISQ